MDETNKQYRRELLTVALRDGDLQNLIIQGQENHGPSFVVIVACTRTDPGRTFLRLFGRCARDNVGLQRGVRESLAIARAASVVLPIDAFLPLADRLAATLAESIRDLGSRPGVVPVAVLGGGAVMPVGVSAVGPDGRLPQWLADFSGRVWGVASPSESPASRERRRRAERKQRHGMS